MKAIETPQESIPRAETAYRAVRQRILDNVWPPGHQVLEQTLAEELGMSRTPLREALIRLQQEGLIEVIPRHGMRVLPISPTDMLEIYQILTSLESMASELAAARNLSEEELAPLETASAEMEAALARDDLDAWARADELFHAHLVALSGNHLLVELVHNFWDRAHRARMVTLHLRPKPVNSTREHLDLVSAIRKGNAATAKKIHEQHRKRGASELTEILQRLRLHQV
jgi:DNA-binding GntR family transcriptional regulator